MTGFSIAGFRLWATGQLCAAVSSSLAVSGVFAIGSQTWVARGEPAFEPAIERAIGYLARHEALPAATETSPSANTDTTDELFKRARDEGSNPVLYADLKQRGLLDSTVVHCGGEMGRLPVLQNDAGRAKWGRDHNTNGFSHWIAGGGFKRGHVHGETDEWGHKAVKDVVHHYDWHATLLHTFGLDHTQLAYKRNGTAATLTDGQEARVVTEILA